MEVNSSGTSTFTCSNWTIRKFIISWKNITDGSLFSSQLQANPTYLKESTIVLPVQINGKTRGTIQVEETCTEEDAFQLAQQDEKLSKYLQGQSIKKRIFVPGKILNVILDRQSTKVACWYCRTTCCSDRNIFQTIYTDRCVRQIVIQACCDYKCIEQNDSS